MGWGDKDNALEIGMWEKGKGVEVEGGRKGKIIGRRLLVVSGAITSWTITGTSNLTLIIFSMQITCSVPSMFFMLWAPATTLKSSGPPRLERTWKWIIFCICEAFFLFSRQNFTKRIDQNVYITCEHNEPQSKPSLHSGCWHHKYG